MKAQELKGLSSEELAQKEKTFKKELFELNYERKIGQVQKPSQFRILKRGIARIMTILREREIEDARNSNSAE